MPQNSRVIVRPFIPFHAHLVGAIAGRANALSESEAEAELAMLEADFSLRHLDIEAIWLNHFQKVRASILPAQIYSRTRQLLIGAMFSGEYALESAALFNPSMVPHPDQTDAPAGGLRFIVSLRATGEGHISSIEFRTGLLTAYGNVQLDPISRFVTLPEVVPNPSYVRARFIRKLQELGVEDRYITEVMLPLDSKFTLQDLLQSMKRVRISFKPYTAPLKRALESIRWLAESNYELRFSSKIALSERIIFPVSPNESNGIEDARFVRFTEDDGSVTYYATYTAYNGRVILPQFIETEDFLNFRVLTLNGNALQNKGMALFPRRIGGRYAMLSRQDDENLFIMFSDNLHHWSDPKRIMSPAFVWEAIKIGNCGSPIETELGWLVITHGVGPMRRYCIGAALLDLHEPDKVIGRLKLPLLCPAGHEREGYVPNVVYSCGSLRHNRMLILPYAVSDTSSTIATIDLDELLRALMEV